eukprot:TRINITY_DN969_c0_g1_i8.p3 TRINITY_DN969_c0_g1~~TRINITY_DN969_c0_g1_i8.p3  ORF type:complete len:167 (+),score=52.77 TRINITY_DN969_c0_g1_i8:73-573(+)
MCIRDRSVPNEPNVAEAISVHSGAEHGEGSGEEKEELEDRKEEHESSTKSVQEPIPERILGLKETLVKILKMTKDEKGRDLYNHIKKIFVQLALTDPSTALDKFEEISYQLRTTSKIPIPERFLNYYQLSVASQAWTNSLRERYFEVSVKVMSRVRRWKEKEGMRR